MNYHNILHDDMRNGEGLRVVLFVSGCDHKCFNCQNPQTWNCDSGIEFDKAAREEIFKQLNNDYISGITFSGGDPLHKDNLEEVLDLIREIKTKFPTKNIWLYTGYTWNYIFDYINTVDVLSNEKRQNILKFVDVLVDGRYEENNADVNYHWAGSTNQKVIDVQKSLKKGDVVLWDTF